MDSGSVWQQQYSRDPEGRVGELCIVDKGSSRCEDWRHDLGRECREGSLKQVSLSRVRLLLWVCLLYLIENSSWIDAVVGVGLLGDLVFALTKLGMSALGCRGMFKPFFLCQVSST